MRVSRCALAVVACALAFAVGGATPAAGQYVVGHVWDRESDWTEPPDSASGTTQGNPDDDALGNPVWTYEYYDNVPDGSDLDTADGLPPWYTLLPSATLMKWDHSWGTAGGEARWSMSDDHQPQTGDAWLAHFNMEAPSSYQPHMHPYVPMVRWTNPTNRPMVVSVTGSFLLAWRSNEATTTNVDVDVALAMVDVSNGDAITPIFAETIPKPSNDESKEELSVDLLGWQVSLGPGDQIVLSPRATGCFTETRPSPVAHWITMYDDVSIEIVAMLPNPTESIKGRYMAGGFTPTGGKFGLGVLAIADTVDIEVNAEWGKTYENAAFSMAVPLFKDDSNDGIAAGVFKDGLLSITDALGHTLLTGDVTMLSVEEVEVLGMSFLAGRGQFQVTGGELAGDFQETLGDIVQVSFDLSPTNIDGLSSPFTYVSNVTLTPVPEPGTLALLAIGAAAAVLRRRRLAG